MDNFVRQHVSTSRTAGRVFVGSENEMGSVGESVRVMLLGERVGGGPAVHAQSREIDAEERFELLSDRSRKFLAQPKGRRGGGR